MEIEEIITATEASRQFSEMLHRVCYGGESFVIKKGNRLMARITPVEILQETAAAALQEETVQPPVLADIPAPDPVDVSADEAAYYEAWMEQVRKVELMDV